MIPEFLFIDRLAVLRGADELATVDGRIEPKSISEMLSLTQGGVISMDHTAWLLPTDVRSSDRLRYEPDDGRRYTVLRVRSRRGGETSDLYLDCDLRMVTYTHLVTILRAVTGQDAVGGETKAWGVLPGYEGIPAVIGPSGQEFEQPRAAGSDLVRGEYTITLEGHWPAVTPEMKATDGRREYDIRQVDHDILQAVTTLRARTLTP